MSIVKSTIIEVQYTVHPAFYLVSYDFSDPIIIEATNYDQAANVYAAITELHPYTIYCSCCGNRGNVRIIETDEYNEYVNDGVCVFRYTDYCYTDELMGATYKRHYRDWM